VRRAGGGGGVCCGALFGQATDRRAGFLANGHDRARVSAYGRGGIWRWSSGKEAEGEKGRKGGEARVRCVRDSEHALGFWPPCVLSTLASAGE
jgi:hypothetical protein